MRLEPLFARVLLEREKPGKIGSVHIPEEWAKRNASTRCRVLAKGPTADKSIEIGATYLIGQHAGTWINANGRAVPGPEDAEFYLTADEDLLCKVIEDET